MPILTLLGLFINNIKENLKDYLKICLLVCKLCIFIDKFI